jgi:predicted NACHT family NTPase
MFLDKPVQSALEILRESDCPYALILGDPGAGKSSLLQYLTLDWAEKPTAEIPLLIELREYVTDENKPKDFLEFFHQGKRKICELNQLQLHQQLQAGKALVMFDGLDEIFDKHRRDGVITEIIAFTNKYPQVRVIVSSRSVGYDAGRLENAGFRHFTLDDLNEAQIREFIEKWHCFALLDETGSERTEMRKRLQDAIKDSPAMRELAGNPLLLTMMAILNRKQTLPRNRANLYEEAAKLLLHNWDIEYKKMQLTLDDVNLSSKQTMLRHIAFYMQASEEGLKANSIQRDALEKEFVSYLKTRDMPNPLRVSGQLIDQLRQRNFILCHYGNDAPCVSKVVHSV